MSAEISTAVEAPDHLINAKHRIMDGGHSIRNYASFHCHRSALGRIPRPRPEVLRRLAGRVRHVYWLNPEPQHEWDTTDSLMSAYAPSATKCSRSATWAT
jgi:hypothetical protein